MPRMCSRFQSVRLDSDLRGFFKAVPAGLPPELKQDVFPGYAAPFVRRPREWGSGDDAVPAREAPLGLFGLLPHWAKDTKLAKSTYNARSETCVNLSERHISAPGGRGRSPTPTPQAERP